MSGARRRDPKSPHSSEFITFAPLLGISSPFHINAGSPLPSSAWCISKQFSFAIDMTCATVFGVRRGYPFIVLQSTLINQECVPSLANMPFRKWFHERKIHQHCVGHVVLCFLALRGANVGRNPAGRQAYLNHTENHRGEWSDCNKPSLWRRRCMHKKPCPGSDKGG